MTTHESTELGAYCLGALEAMDARAVEQHLETCPECRGELDELAEVRDLLDRVPPEALLDGPAEDELLLARLLRAADLRTEAPPPAEHTADGTAEHESAPHGTRTEDTARADASGRSDAVPRPGDVGKPSEITEPGEIEEPERIGDEPGPTGTPGGPSVSRVRSHRSRRWYRGPLLVAAAAVVLAGVFAGGLFTGRQTAPAPQSVAVAPPAGARTISATNPATGVGMSIDLVHNPGWVSLQGHFTGVTPGTPCEIYLITRSGQRILAGGWVAPANANRVVVTVTGSAVIGSTQIVSIEIDTDSGRNLVSAAT